MRSRIYVLAFGVLLVIYLGLTFGLPVNPETLERYQLNETQARLLNLSVVVPLVLIWLVAFYGFLNLRKYAHAVASTKEGRAFHYLSLGLLVLAFSLPLNSIITTTFRHISTEHTNVLIPLTITRNHINVLLSVATFWLLLIGATALVKSIARKPMPVIPTRLNIGLMSFAAIYAWLITSRPINQGLEEKVYFLPNWILIMTLVIPYLLAWRAGFITTYYVYKFHQNVRGVIYKSAFKDLGRGIGVIVFVAVLIQLITTSSAQLNRLNLTPILFIVYGLLIMYAVGFGLVARGAKKLKRLEEV